MTSGVVVRPPPERENATVEPWNGVGSHVAQQQEPIYNATDLRRIASNDLSTPQTRGLVAFLLSATQEETTGRSS